MPSGELSLNLPHASAALSSAAPAAVAAAENRAGRLSLHGISKRFANSENLILDNITLDIEPGEFVVVVGPSGCGKTTLLNIAAGMVHPNSGAATLDGKPITSPGPERAMVFQDHALFPWLTAGQNVEFGLKMARVPARQRARQVADVLRIVQLPGSGDKLVHQLSGGMRQRIAIARALVMNPSVLLMDEPFAALDAQTRTLLHHQLQLIWLQTHTTILFVTHSVGEAVRLADRIIVLHAHPGRIRKEFRVDLPHPRKFDSPDIGELARLVRREIEDEVNRVNALADDAWNAQTTSDLGSFADDMGGGI
jgi:NitT/TauT family transport system ATP-binding protein